MVILNKKKIAHARMLKRGELIRKLQENFNKNWTHREQITVGEFRACLKKSIKESLEQ